MMKERQPDCICYKEKGQQAAIDLVTSVNGDNKDARVPGRVLDQHPNAVCIALAVVFVPTLSQQWLTESVLICPRKRVL